MPNKREFKNNIQTWALAEMRTWRRRWQQEMKVGRQNCPDSGKHRSCPKVTRPASQMNQSLLPDPIFDGRLLEIARQELIVGFVGFSISVGSEFDLLLIPAIFVIPRRRAFIFILRILFHRARCSNRSPQSRAGTEPER
jgi:hypothetical protein